MRNDDMNFRNFLSFRLGALSRDLARYFNSCFAKYNITIGQALVLFYLLDNEESSVKEIAQYLELDSPAISRLIDRLIKEDLIKREEDNEDRRTLKISLTPKGWSVAENALPISAGYNQMIKKKLGDKNYLIFQKCLSEIKKTVG